LEEANEQEAESSQQILERARQYRDQAVANIHRQAEEANKKRVYNPPLSFDRPRTEYRPPKTCADLYCQIHVSEGQDYCAYHQWERENDERLNAERDQVFPNLPPRNPEPNPDLRTTVETDSESETENPEPREEVGDSLNETSNPDENNPEILPEPAEQGTAEENPRTDETEQGSPPGNDETENETTNGGRSWGKFWEEWKPTFKTTAKWGGGISLTGGLVGVLPAAIGYIAMNAQIATWAAKFCQASVYAQKVGWTVEGLSAAKSAGLSFKTCW